MAEGEYQRMVCVDCGTGFAKVAGRGRSRIRCIECSPIQAKPEAERLAARTRQATCPCCEVVFTCTYGGQAYCGDTCRVKAANRAKQEQIRNDVPRPCAWCDTV
jgi:hypothetical protein